ncbi:MAG: succinate dehydrogenase cytochrome b subunit [Ekhidna sp.]|nr:succinate dehydrogenase cytochrome b subunit [Ekhidna sp.]MBC6409421.1 succinate dehydrogenase cytochrome b subunit [Ekhidna sp.]MBC6426386.1 succinate dehydrogenase cytochrome b subunit [Ekhidna sp.]
MSWTKQFFKSSIGRKFGMALSALFLMIFLLQHFAINFTSTFSPEIFNELSHFMGTNPAVQFLLQPVLIFGVLYHFIMGFVLQAQNRAARGSYKYVSYKGSENSSWFSRNMIYTGLVILCFLGLHFYDFWIPEMNYKYIEFNPADTERYYPELVHKFENPIRVSIYVISFVLLAMHLLHGFQSSLQSVGASHPKYSSLIEKLGKGYAILIPAGFIFIALFHHLSHF